MSGSKAKQKGSRNLIGPKCPGKKQNKKVIEKQNKKRPNWQKSGSKAKQKKSRQGADTPHLIQQLRAALAWGELLQVIFTLKSSVRHLPRFFGCSSIAVDVLPGVPDIKPRNSDEEV